MASDFDPPAFDLSRAVLHDLLDGADVEATILEMSRALQNARARISVLERAIDVWRELGPLLDAIEEPIDAHTLAAAHVMDAWRAIRPIVMATIPQDKP